MRSLVGGIKRDYPLIGVTTKKEFFMKKNLLKFWLGMLVMVLAFGMTVPGCEDTDPGNTEEEKDTTPLPPTGLAGTVDGNSIQLTWQAVENASVYSVEFRKESVGEYQAINDVNSTSYTITDLDSNANYQFRVAAQNTKGEKSGYSPAVTKTTGDAKNGEVFIKSFSTTHRTTTVGGNSNHSYTITVELELAKGAVWKWESSQRTSFHASLQGWVDLTPPQGFTFDSTSVGFSGMKSILVRYSSLINSSPLAAPNLTVDIVQSKVSEMKGYTNITDSLAVGTPSTASSTAWVDSD